MNTQQQTQQIAPTAYIEDRVLDLMQQADQFGYAIVAPNVYLNYTQGLDFDEEGNRIEGYWVNKSNGYMSQMQLNFDEIVAELEDYIIDEYNSFDSSWVKGCQ